MSHTLQGTMNIGNNIKWSTVEIPNNRIPGTDNESPTVVEGTLDLIYARDEGTGLGVTNTHVVTPITGPVIILSTYLLCFHPHWKQCWMSELVFLHIFYSILMIGFNPFCSLSNTNSEYLGAKISI